MFNRCFSVRIIAALLLAFIASGCGQVSEQGEVGQPQTVNGTGDSPSIPGAEDPASQEAALNRSGKSGPELPAGNAPVESPNPASQSLAPGVAYPGPEKSGQQAETPNTASATQMSAAVAVSTSVSNSATLSPVEKEATQEAALDQSGKPGLLPTAYPSSPSEPSSMPGCFSPATSSGTPALTRCAGKEKDSA